MAPVCKLVHEAINKDWLPIRIRPEDKIIPAPTRRPGLLDDAEPPYVQHFPSSIPPITTQVNKMTPFESDTLDTSVEVLKAVLISTTF